MSAAASASGSEDPEPYSRGAPAAPRLWTRAFVDLLIARGAVRLLVRAVRAAAEAARRRLRRDGRADRRGHGLVRRREPGDDPADRADREAARLPPHDGAGHRAAGRVGARVPVHPQRGRARRRAARPAGHRLVADVRRRHVAGRRGRAARSVSATASASTARSALATSALGPAVAEPIADALRRAAAVPDLRGGRPGRRLVLPPPAHRRGARRRRAAPRRAKSGAARSRADRDRRARGRQPGRRGGVDVRGAVRAHARDRRRARILRDVHAHGAGRAHRRHAPRRSPRAPQDRVRGRGRLRPGHDRARRRPVPST